MLESARLFGALEKLWEELDSNSDVLTLIRTAGEVDLGPAITWELCHDIFKSCQGNVMHAIRCLLCVLLTVEDEDTELCEYVDEVVKNNSLDWCLELLGYLRDNSSIYGSIPLHSRMFVFRALCNRLPEHEEALFELYAGIGMSILLDDNYSLDEYEFYSNRDVLAQTYGIDDAINPTMTPIVNRLKGNRPGVMKQLLTILTSSDARKSNSYANIGTLMGKTDLDRTLLAYMPLPDEMVMNIRTPFMTEASLVYLLAYTVFTRDSFEKHLEPFEQAFQTCSYTRLLWLLRQLRYPESALDSEEDGASTTGQLCIEGQRDVPVSEEPAPKTALRLQGPQDDMQVEERPLPILQPIDGYAEESWERFEKTYSMGAFIQAGALLTSSVTGLKRLEGFFAGE
ncbi:hypothetical protein GMRT_12383 [Giardia muris]|uniref:Uncharacterized protein n=1 Tax=Giardia muris TaxID=5742 RepID=A0A4Z1SNN8_GIAMU|nr:hypothetical protein GMRT_12383 [Giardia muris]|eukprot:TNJ27260.1 hypothetical protein GMRT_12383 [Giardia muris]